MNIISIFVDSFSSRYAEDVENRLRIIGLVCNIGYPPPELSTIEVVDRIARCGTLYAIVVSSQNVTHQSCTLNVLFGTRQGMDGFTFLTNLSPFHITRLSSVYNLPSVYIHNLKT